MKNEKRISFYNEDGTMKDKNEVIKNIESLYDEASENNESEMVSDMLAFYTNQNNDFNPTNSVEKFQFVERKLYLNEEITPEYGQTFLERIQFWNAEDDFAERPIEERIPIQIYINTPGGDLVTTMMIVDMIKSSKTPVYTIVTGSAYSGGFFISIAGHKRFGFTHSSYLFHEGSACITGDAHKVNQYASYYKEILLKQVKKHVLATTKISNELYEKHKKDDWYLDAEKAKKLGIIDEINNDSNGGIYNEQ